MTTNDEAIIDFKKIEGPVYTGRDRGERLREQLNLNSFDTAEGSVKVIIPEQTYSISSSFFLGMFGPSILKAASREKFLSKYQFETSQFLLGVIDKHIARALQERNLFS
jgi:hypothetical protein